MIHSWFLSFPQLFYFIEDAPLLCILEDFLLQLDEFLMEQESNLDFTPDLEQEIKGNWVEIGKAGVETGKERVETGGGEVFDDGEAVKSKEEGVKTVGVTYGGKEKEEPAAVGVDEKYVHALEMYCLLKQRLSDVRCSWRAVVKEALSDHGQHTGRYLWP